MSGFYTKITKFRASDITTLISEQDMAEENYVPSRIRSNGESIFIQILAIVLEPESIGGRIFKVDEENTDTTLQLIMTDLALAAMGFDGLFLVGTITDSVTSCQFIRMILSDNYRTLT